MLLRVYDFGEQMIKFGCCLLEFSANLMAVCAECIHVPRVSYQRLDLPLRKIFCDRYEGVPHLIRRCFWEAVCLAVPLPRFAVSLRVDVAEHAIGIRDLTLLAQSSGGRL